MRGLKQFPNVGQYYQIESHLLQMRGLKHRNSKIIYSILDVASFTDAWIETPQGREFCEHNNVASFTDAWIETSSYIVHSVMTLSHLLQMRGLKQNMQLAKYQNNWVASFTDAWIETVTGNDGRIRENRRIFYRCVD